MLSEKVLQAPSEINAGSYILSYVRISSDTETLSNSHDHAGKDKEMAMLKVAALQLNVGAISSTRWMKRKA